MESGEIKKSITLGAIAVLMLFIIGMPWDLSMAADSFIAESDRAMSPNQTSESAGSELAEVALGDLVADAIREGTGADIAIISGGNLVKALPGGGIREEDARAVFAEDLEIAILKIGEEELKGFLENLIAGPLMGEDEKLDLDSGSPYFPQVSGLSFTWDISQAPGKRIRELSIEEDGSAAGGRVSGDVCLAITMDIKNLIPYDGKAPEAHTYEVAAMRQSEFLIEYLRGQGAIDIPEGDRIVMVGSSDNTIAKEFKLTRWLPYAILVIALIGIPYRRYIRRDSDYQERRDRYRKGLRKK